MLASRSAVRALAWALALTALAITVAIPLPAGVGLAQAEEETKKRKSTVLMTAADDRRLGAEAAKAVEAEIGLYGDPKLNAYVQRIGDRLLRGVPRRGFEYRFVVVDQVEPNAFALPGGYIFISRGLLGLANDEDELACVIGHEITHAANRHSARQQAIQRSSSRLMMPWVRAGRQASYVRDMEREADKGGQMLASAAGWSPWGMSTFLQSLDQRERLLLGHSRRASFFDTHPTSTERAAANAVRASELRWERDPKLGDTRANLLRQIEGLPLGDRPEVGVFLGNWFVHPELDFQLLLPRGWHTTNTARAVGAQAPRRDGVVFMMADQPPGDPKLIADAWVAKHRKEFDLEVEESKSIKVGHTPAQRLKLRAGRRGNSIVVWMLFLPFRDATWRITGAAPSFRADKHERSILTTMRSFRPVTPENKKALQWTRLYVVEAQAGEGFVALGERSSNDWDPTRTALANGMLTDHRFEGGELVKIARTEAWKPQR